MLNESSKSILIIKSSSQGLGPAEIFLKNRDWKIRATTDLREALSYIIQEQPQFIMISIDHTNPRVLMLPRILKQTFPVCVIAFAEKNLPSSLNALSHSGTDYILYPPIAGAAFERLAHKYCRDILNRKNQANDHITYGSRLKDESISINGRPMMTADFLARFVNDDFERILSEVQGDLQINPIPTYNLEHVHADPRALKKDSIIFRSARLALETSCQTESNLSSKPIGMTSQVRCLVVVSQRFSGYLLTAMASGTWEDIFLQSVRDSFIHFLAENGVSLGKSSSLNLDIMSVQFETWALKDAEFLRKSVHLGREVAIAFFPSDTTGLDFLESATQEMVCMNLEEVACDSKVEFNLYVYLPLNDRYLLYTPKGGVFYQSQKQRLNSQGVSKVHVKKFEIPEIQRYRAQIFFNKKIQAFEENQID